MTHTPYFGATNDRGQWFYGRGKSAKALQSGMSSERKQNERIDRHRRDR